MEKLPIYHINTFNCTLGATDLYVNDFKSHLITNSFIENTHSHNFYLLVLFTQGTGVHVIDFDRFEIKKGCLYFLKPGQVHSWSLSEDIDGYIAFFTHEVYHLYFGTKKLDDYSFYGTLKNLPEIVLSDSKSIEFKHYFDLLLAENKRSDSRKTDKMLNILDTMHIEIERLYYSISNHSIHSYHYKVTDLERLVAVHYKEEKLPSFYAEKMHLSLKHLNRICKSVLNMTVTEVIYSKIILESKRLLAVKERSIGEVATAFGFENYSYFTKVFKKYTGVTPQDFRKQLLLF
jgi:AraC-like DNA-binding protein